MLEGMKMDRYSGVLWGSMSGVLDGTGGDRSSLK